MVCIIDDREDVWNFAPNLIVVKPYKYFSGADDVNDPFKENGNNNNEKNTKESGANDSGCSKDKDSKPLVKTTTKDSTQPKEDGEIIDDDETKGPNQECNGTIGVSSKGNKTQGNVRTI